MSERESEEKLEAVVLSNPSGPDLEFTGTLLHKGTYPDLGLIEIYRTAGGKHVLRRISPALRGRPYRDDTMILRSLDELSEALGNSESAKRVFEGIGSPRKVAVD